MNERLLNDIEFLAALFEKGGWRELRVSADDIALLLSHDANASLKREGAAEVAVPPHPSPKASISGQPQPMTDAPSVDTRPEASASAGEGEIDPAWHAVAAPNLGTFYRSPKPGAPPFVEIGQKVEVTTEVCLLEVMKLFTSVSAGVSGTVNRICAADAELVDGGQVLFYIAQD